MKRNLLNRYYKEPANYQSKLHKARALFSLSVTPKPPSNNREATDDLVVFSEARKPSDNSYELAEDLVLLSETHATWNNNYEKTEDFVSLSEAPTPFDYSHEVTKDSVLSETHTTLDNNYEEAEGLISVPETPVFSYNYKPTESLLSFWTSASSDNNYEGANGSVSLSETSALSYDDYKAAENLFFLSETRAPLVNNYEVTDGLILLPETCTPSDNDRQVDEALVLLPETSVPSDYEAEKFVILQNVAEQVAVLIPETYMAKNEAEPVDGVKEEILNSTAPSKGMEEEIFFIPETQSLTDEKEEEVFLVPRTPVLPNELEEEPETPAPLNKAEENMMLETETSEPSNDVEMEDNLISAIYEVKEGIHLTSENLECIVDECAAGKTQSNSENDFVSEIPVPLDGDFEMDQNVLQSTSEEYQAAEILVLLARNYSKKTPFFLSNNEDKREREFYRARGLQCPKDIPLANSVDADEEKNAADAHAEADYHRHDEQVSVCLECISPNLKTLKRRFIRCSAQATIMHLKKFVAKKVLNGVEKYKDIDILCNDELLGKDHTLKFVYVTRWRFQSPPLTLQYRPRIDI